MAIQNSKKKKDIDRYGFYQDMAKIKFTDTHVFIEGLSGSRRKNRLMQNWIRLAEEGYIPVGVKYLNPRVTFDGLNWYISVSVEIPDTKDIKRPETDGIGIDLGIKEFATCSDGTIFHNVNKTTKIRKLEKRKRRLQRSLSRKYQMNKKGESYCKTSNIRKEENRLRKLDKRLKNIRQDSIIRVAVSITGRKPMFVVMEDLDVKGMLSNKRLARHIQGLSFKAARNWMEWMCKKEDIPFILADRWFASSKICHKCGHVKKDLTLKDRVYKCDKCGYKSDRDLNAALNLRQYGLEHLCV